MKILKSNVIIQARMGSTRLPGKTLKNILNKPMLGYLIERIQCVKEPHQLIIATTTNPIDDVIEAFTTKENIPCFRGKEEDVLDRYYQACCKFPCDYVVRITSDCPLMDPSVIDTALQKLKKEKGLDYISNTIHRTYPRGLDVEAFTFQTLETAAFEAKSLWDREHVTPFIYTQPTRFKLFNFTHFPDISKFRLTVDTPEDFLLVSKIFEALYPQNKNFALEDILDILEKHPEWVKINAHIQQKKTN